MMIPPSLYRSILFHLFTPPIYPQDWCCQEHEQDAIIDYARRCRQATTAQFGTLCLVSKSWFKETFKLMYKSPSLFDDDQALTLIRTLNASVHDKTTQPYHLYIKELQIEDLSENIVLQLLSLCPSLYALGLAGHGAAIQLNFNFLQQLFMQPLFGQLTRLSFGSHSDPINIKGFKRLMAQFPTVFANIQSLQLYTPHWLNGIALRMWLKIMPKLTKFFLHDRFPGELELLQYFPRQLTHLSLDLLDINCSSLLDHLEQFPYLQHLCLCHVSGVSSTGFKKLNWPHLRVLDMKHWSFDQFQHKEMQIFVNSHFKRLYHAAFVDIRSNTLHQARQTRIQSNQPTHLSNDNHVIDANLNDNHVIDANLNDNQANLPNNNNSSNQHLDQVEWTEDLIASILDSAPHNALGVDLNAQEVSEGPVETVGVIPLGIMGHRGWTMVDETNDENDLQLWFIQQACQWGRHLRFLDVNRQTPLDRAMRYQFTQLELLECLVLGDWIGVCFDDDIWASHLATDLLFVIQNMKNLTSVFIKTAFRNGYLQFLFDNTMSEFEAYAMLGPNIYPLEPKTAALLPEGLVQVTDLRRQLERHFIELHNVYDLQEIAYQVDLILGYQLSSAESSAILQLEDITWPAQDN